MVTRISVQPIRLAYQEKQGAVPWLLMMEISFARAQVSLSARVVVELGAPLHEWCFQMAPAFCFLQHSQFLKSAPSLGFHHPQASLVHFVHLLLRHLMSSDAASHLEDYCSS